MKIYLAAQFSRKEEMCGYADALRAIGHEVTSRWLGQHDELPYEELTAAGCKRCAEHDVTDVKASDCVISFMEPVGIPNTSRGGRHVEFGLALALEKRLYLVGTPENVFHWYDGVIYFPVWEDCLIHYKRMAETPSRRLKRSAL